MKISVSFVAKYVAVIVTAFCIVDARADDESVLRVYRQTPSATRDGQPFKLLLNPPSDANAKEIFRGEHNPVLIEISRITGSFGLRFFQPKSHIDNAVEICGATGCRIALRLDPWKLKDDSFDPMTFTQAHADRLTNIRKQALIWAGYEQWVDAIIINHEEWSVTGDNVRAIRRKLDKVTAILQQHLPDAVIIHYNFRQRKSHSAPVWLGLPENLSTDFRSCTLYFDRLNQAFEVLDATSSTGMATSFSAPTAPFLSLTNSFLYEEDSGEWWRSKKVFLRWADDYPRGDLFIYQLGGLLSETDAVPFGIIYAPEYLNEAFAKRLRLLTLGINGTKRR